MIANEQSSPVASIVVATACVLGESPLWHPEDGCLYWCDIPVGRVLRFDPATRLVEVVCDRGAVGQVIGGFTLEADEALLLFMGGGRIERWKNGVCEVILEGRPEMSETRFNDVIADPRGRVFCGTMSAAGTCGGLYRLDLDGSLTRVVGNVGCSNGMGFSKDGKTLYYTDSFARTIWRFEYDVKSGALSNQRPFVMTCEEDGSPDGMTVDSEGCIWSAHWDGGFVVRYSPEGREMLRVEVPVKRPTSVIFGGVNLQMLFITSAGGDTPAIHGALAGSIFAVETGVRGAAEFRSRIGMRSIEEVKNACES